eukprot:CAMPEP_0201567174 /NCGR_PEP_ID=MMETSP0190_2-20130828/7541_1 /ASSEMBLY_ACC=CAM_ASM_000263 /TAXON_ID=37353 /ORGANISM="Rosalina sp." /LENGTH=134 /DNA_ID=CAMNT_0047986851 /DNA_START=43 /DNA_END=444 /DNA_ORIENTATION=+
MSISLISAVLVIMISSMVDSTNVRFQNNCPWTVDIYQTQDQIVAAKVTTIAAGGLSGSIAITAGLSGRFTTITDEEATLFEYNLDSWSISNRKFWYNLSIIPPGSLGCYSLSDCQDQTGKVGFNDKMKVTPDYW